MKVRLLISLLCICNGLLSQTPNIDVTIFLSTQCPICQYYIPVLKQLYQTYSAKGVAFNGVFPISNETAQTLDSFAHSYDVPFDLVLDSMQTLAKTMNVRVTPEVVVMAEGKKVYQGRIDDAWDRPGRRRSILRSSDLALVLDLLLQGKMPLISQTQAVGCFITYSLP